MKSRGTRNIVKLKLINQTKAQDLAKISKSNKMLRKILFACLVLAIYSGTAQNEKKITYSLSDCIEIALKNNLDLKSAALKAKTSEVN